MACPRCGSLQQEDDGACAVCMTPGAFEPRPKVGSAVVSHPALPPWKPARRYHCPPSDEPSLGPAPAGMVRLRGLDLDAQLPPHATFESSWLGTLVRVPASERGGEPWVITVTPDSPITTLAEARRALTGGEPRRRLDGLRRSEATRDGWVMVATLSWDRRPYPLMTVRRRLGEMTVDLTSDDRGLDEAELEAIARGLVAVPGGVTGWRMPPGPPLIRIAYGWGCFGGPKGSVSLFADGTAQYLGPRWRTQRGRLVQQDPSAVAELHARLSSAPCCVDASPRVGGRPIELGILVGGEWRHCGGHDVQERFSEIEAWVDLAAV